MEDLISLCFAAIFALLGLVLFFMGIAEPSYTGVLPFILGIGSVIISFRIMP